MKAEQTGPPGPENERSRGSQTPALTQQADWQIASNHHLSSLSRQVAWWEVHLWRERMLNHPGVQAYPMVGTPAWCALRDDHPVKLAAAVDAAQHWALRVETCQEARCQAAQAISAVAGWTAIAKENRDRADFYADRTYLRRVIV